MATAILDLTLQLTAEEADALADLLEGGDKFDNPVSHKVYKYVEHFNLESVLKRLHDSKINSVVNLTLTQTELNSLKRAINAYGRIRPARYIHSVYWAIYKELEHIPSHRISE